MNNIQKMVLVSFFVATSPKNKEAGILASVNDFLNSNPELGKAFHELMQQEIIELQEDTHVLTKKGIAIAYKLTTLGMNYEEAAKRGSFGNAQAMLKGAWAGFKEHCSKKHLYIDSSGFNTVEEVVKEGTELLKGAISTNEEEVVS